MMKEKKLNLEPLIRRPSSAASLLQLTSMEDSDHHDHHQDQPTRRGEEVEQQPLHQPLTIFYNGQVSTCTVDEFQARAILLVARREMEEAMKVSSSSSTCSLKQQASPSSSSRRPGQGPPQLGRSLSMKRSLEQFLHKRKNRTTINTNTNTTASTPTPTPHHH